MKGARVALAVACLTSPLAGQAAPDSAARATPFRAGQWGMEVAINHAVYGVGVLRFTSPTRAWLLDARVGSNWRRTESQVEPDTGVLARDLREEVLQNSVGVLVGRRAYRPLGRRALRMVQGGVRLGVDHDRRRVRGAPYDYDSEFATWSAGVEGGIGGTLRVADDLLLGMLVGGQVSYTWRRTEQTGTRYRFDGVGAILEPARLYLTLVF